MTEPTVQSFEGSDLDLDALEAMCHRANAEGNSVIWRYAEVVNPRAVLALISAAREGKGTRAQSHPFAAQESAVGGRLPSGAWPLEPGLALALKDLARGSPFAPERARRPTFHRLIDLGWAKWLGYGLGGEAFSITPAGLAALSSNEPPSGCERSEQGNPTQAELPPLEQGGEEGAVSCESRAASASPAAPMGERQAGGGEP